MLRLIGHEAAVLHIAKGGSPRVTATLWHRLKLAMAVISGLRDTDPVTDDFVLKIVASVYDKLAAHGLVHSPASAMARALSRETLLPSKEKGPTLAEAVGLAMLENISTMCVLSADDVNLVDWKTQLPDDFDGEILMLRMTEVAPCKAVLSKRTWHYLQPPASFEIAPCSCGNSQTQWSEFDKHLWCSVCEKDFIPEHGGLFDGPIPINLATMLGVCFDRFNLTLQIVEVFDQESITYRPRTDTPTPLLGER
jgi:hypothetical protein